VDRADREEVRERVPFEIELLEQRIAPSAIVMNSPWHDVQWNDGGNGNVYSYVFLGYDPPGTA
jgi:hypothetical protein